MNRRGFFSALAGGLAAATGLRSLIGRPSKPAEWWPTARNAAVEFHYVAGADVQAGRIVFLKTAAMGQSQIVLDTLDGTIALPGTAPWRPPVEHRLAVPDAFEGVRDIPVPAWAVDRDLPEVWPGRSAEITATAGLPPLAQLERLVELFGASGEAAPAFAAALIGELVLTRMRLADLRRVHTAASSHEASA